MSEQDTADQAVYENPASGESFSASDAEAAGWAVVHEGVDVETEGVTLNATHWFAEKYVSPPGRPGGYVQLVGHTEEGLLAAIQQYEQQFAPAEDATVLLPADGVDEVDSSDEGTIKRISAAELAARADNDVLTVLSDPEDPDSEPVQRVISGGVEVDESVLSEPTEPSTQAEAETAAANQAGIDQAIEARDNAENPSDANSPDASLAALGAETDARQAVHDEANAEKTQPEAGEATDASDSEQQSQVPDSEAATSDAEQTNAPDGFPAPQSQPEESGPDTDAEAPAPAPNAGQGVTATGIPTESFGNAGEGEAPKTDVDPSDEHTA